MPFFFFYLGGTGEGIPPQLLKAVLIIWNNVKRAELFDCTMLVKFGATVTQAVSTAAQGMSGLPRRTADYSA